MMFGNAGFRVRSVGCLAGALAAGLLFYGCGRGADLSPPAVAYGQAECELCRMIISEERFAAAAVVQTSAEVRKVAFDDIGCLLEFLRDPPPADRVIPYVHDHDSAAWLPAHDAVFVRSETLQTPMASQLAACRTRNAADAVLSRFPGTLLTLEQLIAQNPRASAQPIEGSAP